MSEDSAAAGTARTLLPPGREEMGESRRGIDGLGGSTAALGVPM